jgi:DNA-binding GntR family transcriptional regulator
MDPLQRPETLNSVVVHHIAEAIVRGDLPAGSQLTEVSLAKQLNTSRGTVREALRELERMGFVDIAPHRGAFVCELSIRRAEEIFTLRAVLEAMAGRLVLERNRPDAAMLAEMEAAVEAQRQAARDGDQLAWVESDMEFHRRLAAYSGHELLQEQLSALQNQTRRFLVSVRQYQAEMATLVDSHLPIIEALATGDPEQLERASYEHVTKSGQRLLARMREESERSAPEPAGA